MPTTRDVKAISEILGKFWMCRDCAIQCQGLDLQMILHATKKSRNFSRQQSPSLGRFEKKNWELAWIEGTKRLEDLQKEAKNGN